MVVGDEEGEEEEETSGVAEGEHFGDEEETGGEGSYSEIIVVTV